MSTTVNGMVFDAIWLLPLAIILPVVAVLVLRYAYRKRQERLQRFGSIEVVSRLIPVTAMTRPRWRMARLGAASEKNSGTLTSKSTRYCAANRTTCAVNYSNFVFQ